jgi:hypothetical protein
MWQQQLRTALGDRILAYVALAAPIALEHIHVQHQRPHNTNSCALPAAVSAVSHLYPAMLAIELRESKVWALLRVRGMQSMPEAAAAAARQ